ncbi:MAG: DUF2029 domain-containing protein [Chloroflexi bacterium]|nr:DUF2029 domain-containing protein [Chloroflexota bacterium]
MARSGRLAAAALPMVALIVFAVDVGAAIAASAVQGTLGFDFLSYDTVVRRFLDGGVLYDQSFDDAGGFGLFYYPPPFVLMALPLAFLDPTLAAWLWTGILIACFFAAVAIMPVSTRVKWAIVLLAGLNWPMVYGIKLGQVGPILLLTFALGWRYMDRPNVLGIATAIGTAIKVQPLLLFGWALLTGRRRAIVVGAIALLVLAAGATAIAGPAAWADHATLLARVSKPIATPNNLTPGRIAFELGASESLAWAIQLLNWALVGLALLFAVLRASAVASYLAIVVASQMVSPILWDHYALLLVLPVAWLLERGRWWAAVIPLVMMIWLLDVTPPIAYPIAFWVTLLAVVWEGLRGREPEADRPSAMPRPAAA